MPRLQKLILLAFLACLSPVTYAVDTAAPKPGEPVSDKARKSFASAVEWEKHRALSAAIGDYRKANQQDGGHCAQCLNRAYKLAMRIGAFKDAEDITRAMLADAQDDADKAAAHYRMALALQREGIDKKKDKCMADSCSEFQAALSAQPALTPVHYGLGVSLARMHRDEEARREFTAFLKEDKMTGVLHERAQRYLENMELARANMAPAFELTTMDGQHVTMDSLAGKVVLIDFWATWCGPCREALPHVRRIAHEFQEQPFVVLSISLDRDEGKWKEFVGKNGMTWLQYRDGSGGSIANLFGVHSIPATFTIDADGVLEDQHVGDADIEGKLKKLIARAAALEKRKPVEGLATREETASE